MNRVLGPAIDALLYENPTKLDKLGTPKFDLREGEMSDISLMWFRFLCLSLSPILVISQVQKEIANDRTTLFITLFILSV